MKQAYSKAEAVFLTVEATDLLTASGEDDKFGAYENPNRTEWDANTKI